ncbi:PAS domain-containing protein [Sorangium sp. So ce834]|uniref:PAS domain-containing protein n=1 Tax=Sorangium sp. So ce834 TaxID=3133321 RepID=UPI003F60C18C
MAEDRPHRDDLQRDNEALRAQNEELRRELAELRRALARPEPADGSPPGAPPPDLGPGAVERTPRNGAPPEDVDVLRAVLEAAPMLLFAKDAGGRYILANGYFLSWARLGWGDVAGKTDHEIFPKERADTFRAADLEVLTTGQTLSWDEGDVSPDGQLHHFAVLKFPLRDAAGAVRGVCGVSTDITSYKRAEAENQELQAEIIRAQERSLRALSTPLLPIAKGVLVMPLIGDIDQRRAQSALEVLLGGIVAHEARRVILDITGVPAVDADVANALVKTAQAVGMLGATVIVTGIQPKIAETLVELGADLSGLVTRSTLESGIAHALKG